MVPLGTPLPEFRLPAVQGEEVDSTGYRGRVLVILFLCNHCPFVRHLSDGLASFGRDMRALGVGVVAISSNDPEKYPADAPDRMREVAAASGWDFPYAFDGTQAVARLFRAACTPDFFVYDTAGLLAYRGQFDASRPGNGKPVTGEDLRGAVNNLLAGRPVPVRQVPSVGCNIKWKPGNEPDYFRR